MMNVTSFYSYTTPPPGTNGTVLAKVPSTSGSLVPAIIHFTYYELNFFDIVFIACLFILKFFITSLFLIFALVSINGNSYPQLLQRCSESRQMSAGTSLGPRTPYQNGANGCRRRDLLCTMAALNIISGNVQALLDYVSTLQRFLYCTSWTEKTTITKQWWRRWIGRLPGNRGNNNLNQTSNRVQSVPPPITPTVVFIDSEPGVAVKRLMVSGEDQADCQVAPEPPQHLRPTLKLRVRNTAEGSSMIVRAVIDPSSVCSYISDQVVTNLRSRKYFIWPCFFRYFPGPVAKYVHQATTVVLQSIDQYSDDVSEQGSFATLRTSDPVELLIPTEHVRAQFGQPPPTPSAQLQALLQTRAGIQLCDGLTSLHYGTSQLLFQTTEDLVTTTTGSFTSSPSPQPLQSESGDDAPEVGMIIGQDLLYSTILGGQSAVHKTLVLEQDLFVIKTAYGWVAHGSVASHRLTDSAQVLTVEVDSLGILERDYQLERKRCTETVRIMCCPMQILVSILVLLIYIVIPFVDALLYLYNILFHLAIAFALAQILALVFGPLLAVCQSLIAWRLAITLHLIKVNIIRVYSALARPILLVYRFLLAGVWVSLYWFLSMGKALFAQWNYSTLEAEHTVRFAANFTVRYEGQSIHVRLDPCIDRSSISSRLVQPAISTSDILGVPMEHFELNWTRLDEDHVGVVVRGQRLKLWIAADEEPVIVLGGDVLGRGNDCGSLASVVSEALLLRPSGGGGGGGKSKSTLTLVPVEVSSDTVSVTDSGCTASGGGPLSTRQCWVLQQRYSPFGWRVVLTCRYWFARANFVYLAFFLAYAFLLAVIYFCVIAPHELTLISARPTMFRYIGNFILFSARGL